MFPLKEKSSQNIAAAKILIERDHPNASVHCSYYSCVQLMLHILLNKFGETHETLKKMGFDQNKGSHEIAINLLYRHFGTKVDEARKFNRLIGQLKLMRVAIDYKDALIDKEKGREVRRNALEVTELLENTFL